MRKEDKIFYDTVLRLQLEDYKSGKVTMTIKDAEELYNVYGITTTLRDGKIEFGGIYE